MRSLSLSVSLAVSDYKEFETSTQLTCYNVSTNVCIYTLGDQDYVCVKALCLPSCLPYIRVFPVLFERPEVALRWREGGGCFH